MYKITLSPFFNTRSKKPEFEDKGPRITNTPQTKKKKRNQVLGSLCHQPSLSSRRLGRRDRRGGCSKPLLRRRTTVTGLLEISGDEPLGDDEQPSSGAWSSKPPARRLKKGHHTSQGSRRRSWPPCVSLESAARTRTTTLQKLKKTGSISSTPRLHGRPEEKTISASHPLQSDCQRQAYWSSGLSFTSMTSAMETDR